MIIGSVITENIVRKDPRYAKKKTITLSDISTYTKEQGSVYDAEALEKVSEMKKKYGSGVCALVRIYNACGESLSLTNTHDWHGHIGDYPFDGIIQNGEWSVFLHVHSTGAAAGSCGATVYRASKANQDNFLGWESPFSGSNSVYVETRETGHWPGQGSWNYMEDQIDKHNSSSISTWGVLQVNGEIAQSSSPIVNFSIIHP